MNSSHKILFLDIDGVLNSYEYWDSAEYESYCKAVERDKDAFDMSMEIDMDAVKVLNTLFKQDDTIKIVVSSTWRGVDNNRLDNVKRYLQNRGFKYTQNIVGGTPSISSVPRGTEIEKWLQAYSLEHFKDKKYENVSYCIIDDDSDMLEKQKSHFIQIDTKVGITKYDIENILTILKSKEVIS